MISHGRVTRWQALIRMYSELFPKQAAAEPQLITEAVTDHTSFVLAGERQGPLLLVGGVSVRMPEMHDIAVIEYIGTRFQRSGYGRRLLDAVCDHLRSVQRSNTPLYVYADLRAVAFFLSNGAHASSPPFAEDLK